MYFKIRRNGEVTDVKLEQSSGSIAFDQAAQRAVYSANPMPPLPTGSGLETLGVHFDFMAY
jgi:protein TonB